MKANESWFAAGACLGVAYAGVLAVISVKELGVPVTADFITGLMVLGVLALTGMYFVCRARALGEGKS